MKLNQLLGKTPRQFLRLLPVVILAAVTTAAVADNRGHDSDRGRDKAPLTQLVLTSEGRVRGFEKDGVRQFLGIPYAAPPVGALRWQPPQAHQQRRQPLRALSYGPTCAQINTLGVFAAPSDSEDCLYLNVFAPEAKKGHGHRSSALPVMVWIHGGGNFDGESNDYDGSKLARDGTVVVTINYRLNLFGFLAHPALDAEGHPAANYGIMDQQFALQWVRRNIRAFGGNPDNVTIFGESAGGQDTLAHLVSPASAGLFHRGIIESGAYSLLSGLPTLAAAEATGQAFATAAGCSNQTAACLRSLSVQDILTRSDAFNRGIVVDGTIIPQAFGTALAAGQFNRVPLINGTTRDEFRFFIPLFGGEATAETYPARIAALYGANAPAVLAHYPLSSFGSASEALAATVTDQVFACTARRLNRLASKFVPVFAFEFADRTAPSYAPLPSFPYGAAHTFEIMYLFPLYHGGLGTPHPLNQAQERLSDDMVDYWTTFAKLGDPNSGYTPYWPNFTVPAELVQSLQLPRPVTISTFGTEHQCDFWDGLQ